MTIEEFQKEYCSRCGTQSCYGDEESIAGCGYYNDDIDGIVKIHSIFDSPEFKAYIEQYCKDNAEMLEKVFNPHGKRGLRSECLCCWPKSKT